MIVDAYVLPAPGEVPESRGRGVGVVFWERPHRARGRTAGVAGSRLAVYAPEDLSPGELAELRAALLAALGDAFAPAWRGDSRVMVVVWWLLGVAAAALLALRALEFGPAYSWLALLAVMATLPSIGRAASPTVARQTGLAGTLARRMGELEASMGEDPRARERVTALWQLARRQRGSAGEQLAALESHCREQAWPAAARVYAERRTGAVRPRGTLDRLLRRPARPASGAPPYAILDMRAWL
ncbi:MAG: hypothetical protein AVDCRST_MAG77-1685 [uncultured Chloroflexi bacterium]|uniref:Uncharacterized protein n=1 Tax=uncultured Chloroflexota bacterium TaxID=166587 RepID=A0A6J4I6I7_9CHLR|nr:MAG: hypothetical protein AVDCRST_MAG77-1685 [uncultured Chloroflexota bacterium]